MPAFGSGFRTPGWKQRNYSECPKHLVHISQRKQSPLRKSRIADTRAPPHLQRGVIKGAFSRPFTPSPYESVQSHSAFRLNSVHCCAFKNQILLLKFPISWSKKTPKQKSKRPGFSSPPGPRVNVTNSWVLNQHSLSSLAQWLFQLGWCCKVRPVKPHTAPCAPLTLSLFKLLVSYTALWPRSVPSPSNTTKNLLMKQKIQHLIIMLC